MSVVVVGLEHHQAPLDLLERVTVGEADLAKVLASLRDRENLQETVLLSTCLRTEVYAVVDRFHDAVSEVQELLSERAGLRVDDLEQYLSIRFDADVPTHLFSVAAGLESAVPGETEVLGQVRRAWQRADAERVSGPVLAALFRHAVQTGRRVRTETGIARGTTSFSHAAVELAERRLDGGLAGRSVAVVGAGDMGAGLVRALLGRPAGQGPREVLVVNRTLARARQLLAGAPDQVSTRALALPTRAPAGPLARADVVLSAVRADGHVLGAAQLAPDGARARPLLVVDLGMPRNVDPAVGAVDGVTLLDMDALRSAVGEAMDERRSEADRARRVVHEEVSRYGASSRAQGAAPVVAALRSRLERTRTAELARRRAQFGDLSAEQWTQVDSVTRAVMAKLLHEPTMLLKESSGTQRGERLVEALRILFDL